MDKVLVIKPNGEAIPCTRVVHQQQTWVGLLQMHAIFLSKTALQSFKNGLKKHGVKQRLATPLERRFMAWTKAVGARAASCTLLELTSLCQMLHQFIFEPTIISTIASIQHLPAQAVEDQMGNDLGVQRPIKLPQLKLSRADYSMHFSLHPAEQEKEPVKSQVQALFAWLKEDIQLDRQNAPLAFRTRENMAKHIWQYLGFLQLHLKRDQVSLLDFLDLNRYASYISFHKGKGNCYSTIVVHITTAKSILHYLGATNRATIVQIQESKAWLSTVQKQLAMLMPKAVPDLELPKAHTVVRYITQFSVRVFQQTPKLSSGQPYTPVQARNIHDAALACCMFGYLPPVRLVCLRTLQLPNTNGCLTPGCTRHGCQGNRLLVKDGHFHMLLSHYKVERRSVIDPHPSYTLIDVHHK